MTWTDSLDSLGFNVSYIEANFSGTLQNYTANRDGNVSYYKIILPAGTYKWKFYANDSNDNWNSTDTWYATINKHSNPIKWSITNSSGTYTNQNVTTDNSTAINITAWLYYSNSGTLKLYNDTAEEPLTLLRSFSPGIYNYTSNTTGNANYTSNKTIFTLTVVASTTTTTTTTTTSTTTIPPCLGDGGVCRIKEVLNDTACRKTDGNTLSGDEWQAGYIGSFEEGSTLTVEEVRKSNERCFEEYIQPNFYDYL